jgi:hypothetical protein
MYRIPKTTCSITTSTNMKSPSPAERTDIYPATLINSILQSASNRTDSQAFPIRTTTTNTNTNTSPESEAVKRQRLLMIIDAVIALLDGDTSQSQ